MCGYPLQQYIPILYSFSDKMVLHIYMFGSFTLDPILGHCYG